MGQGVAVLVVFASKSLDMVLACLNRAFLGTFGLVRKHVCLEILENLAAVGMRTALLFLGLVARREVTRAWGNKAAEARTAGIGVHGIRVVVKGWQGSCRLLKGSAVVWSSVQEGRGTRVADHGELGRRGDGGRGRIGVVMRLMVELGVIVVLMKESHGRTIDLRVDQGRVCQGRKSKKQQVSNKARTIREWVEDEDKRRRRSGSASEGPAGVGKRGAGS